MIIAEVTITPLGEGASVSKYVKIALDVIKKSGCNYMLTPMSTIIETSTIDELFSMVSKAERAVLDAGAQRVVIDIKVDHRTDKDAKMQSKINAVIK